MNKGAGHHGLKEAGFTIVETMIVLAVTGALFISIAATLAGRQNEAEFVHAIQDAQAQIQQVITQVSDGYYPNNNNFTCTASGGSINITNNPGINSQQGSNYGCLFLGKVIQFGVANNTDPNQNEQYQVYTIAGLQFNGSLGSQVGNTSPFQNVDPTVVGAFTGSDVGLSNYSISGSLEYGLSTLWIKVNKISGPTQVGSVGFLMEPGSLNSNQTGYNSGSQPIDLIPIDGTSLMEDQISAVNNIDSTLRDSNLTADAPINPSTGVQVCMVSGGTNQSGLISIGNSSGTLLVSLSIKSNRTCS